MPGSVQAPRHPSSRHTLEVCSEQNQTTPGRRETGVRPDRGRALILTGLVTAAGPAGAADEPTELIVNGGFENGTTGWIVNNGNATDGGTLAVTADAVTGTSAAAITGRLTTGTGPMQDLSGKVQAGYVYTLSAKIKYENAASPATKQFFATMHYGGSTYTNLVSVTANRGQWATFSGTFTIPATQSVTTARILLGQR